MCTSPYPTKNSNEQTIGSVTDLHNTGRCHLDSLALAFYNPSLQKLGKETHRAVAGIMPITGRWVTNLMVWLVTGLFEIRAV